MSNFLFQEEEERKRKEEQERKEHEEYLLLKEQFTVEEEGVGETAEEVRFCHVIYYLQLKKMRVHMCFSLQLNVASFIVKLIKVQLPEIFQKC